MIQKITSLSNGEITEKLKKSRKASGLTQQEMAELLQLSRETISAIENNKENTISSLPAQTIINWYNACANKMSADEKSTFIYTIMSYFKM